MGQQYSIISESDSISGTWITTSSGIVTSTGENCLLYQIPAGGVITIKVYDYSGGPAIIPGTNFKVNSFSYMFADLSCDGTVNCQWTINVQGDSTSRVSTSVNGTNLNTVESSAFTLNNSTINSYFAYENNTLDSVNLTLSNNNTTQISLKLYNVYFSTASAWNACFVQGTRANGSQNVTTDDRNGTVITRFPAFSEYDSANFTQLQQ